MFPCGGVLVSNISTNGANTIRDFNILIKAGKYGTGAILFCPSDTRGIKDEDNSLNVPPYGTAPLGTNKPECSYAYAFGLNSMSPFSPATVRLSSTTVRNMPVNCKENTHALAADMNGEYDTGNRPPITQFNFRYFLSGTGNKNHGRSGVNVLKIDGHVQWCTLTSIPETQYCVPDPPLAVVWGSVRLAGRISLSSEGFMCNP